MERQAKVVVIGGGIAGNSIAYHLTALGLRDVIVLEQSEPVSGTTSHAPGLVGQLRSSASLTKMLMHSVSLYKELRLDGQPGYFGVGSLRLASSKERLLELKRQLSFARTVGLDCELIGPGEAKRLFPLMSLDGVEGALWLPTDGSARAVILAKALAEKAKAGSARTLSNSRVIAIESKNGRVSAVRTERETIRCESVACAAGIWSPRIGQLAGVSVPLTPMQHQYALSEPLPELKGLSVPNLRDPDKLIYYRQDGEGFVIGGYERDPWPFNVEDIPDNANPTVRTYSESHFDPLLKATVERVPALNGIRMSKTVNGLESFTPDGEFLLGESPEVRGFYVAAGFCAHGVSGSGGVGKMLAEWIVEGEPSLDLWHMDIRRFGAHAQKPEYIRARASEVYATYYDLALPYRERESARGLRKSPLYDRLARLGATFGEKMGWERVNWFASYEKAGDELDFDRPRGWAAKNWSPAVAFEHAACRERVALFDESSFSKVELSGPGALAFLQRIAANQMDQALGAVTYTQMLNERGGIECDLTVTRLAADRFRVVTGTAFGIHDVAWIARHAPEDGSVKVEEVTDKYCCVGLWGPRSRELLKAVCGGPLSNADFPYMSSRSVVAGGVAALALRVTYVGELGWELYTEMEHGARLWDALWAAGKPLGVAAAGYRAIDSLRLEKGYRYWSAEIHSEYDPYEAGLGFAVKLGKGEFLGKAALEKKKAAGLSRKLCCLTLRDPAAWALGGESISHDGRVVGRVTSGGYGYTLKKSIAYGYLPVALASPGTKVAVDWFGETIPAVVEKEPLYDPTGARIKS